MLSAILLKINLKGTLKGNVKHVDYQSYTVDQSPIGAKYSDWVTKKILHTDRETQNCYRKTTIPESLVKTWAYGDCPNWEKPSAWKEYPISKKIESHLRRYDEGFGYSFEFLED